MEVDRLSGREWTRPFGVLQWIRTERRWNTEPPHQETLHSQIQRIGPVIVKRRIVGEQSLTRVIIGVNDTEDVLGDQLVNGEHRIQLCVNARAMP